MPLRRRVPVLAAVALAGLSCVEGPFEPWEPTRDDRVLRFLAGDAASQPSIGLTPGAFVTDTAVDVDIRLREAPRVAAFAFEIIVDGGGAEVAALREGTFFLPADRVTLLEFAPAPDEPQRWIGLVALDSLTPGVGGSGVLGTLRVRRTSNLAFETPLRFEPDRSIAYDDAGEPLTISFAPGRLVHSPRRVE